MPRTARSTAVLPLVAVAASLISALACSRRPARDLPPTLVWHKDQGLIRPADGTLNVWEGFRVAGDHFASEGGFSQFILWRRRAGAADVRIEYSLSGRRVDFTVNAGQRRRLRPAAAFRSERFRLTLNRGMNFLQFFAKGGMQLRVRSVAVGQAGKKPGAHLLPGEGISLFLPPGRGRLDLRGRGRIETAERAGGDESAEPGVRLLKSGWLSRGISVPLQSAVPALLTVKVQQGAFDVRSLEYSESAPAPPPALPSWSGKPNIYVVLSDACQASHLGVYGYARPTSPHIDAFARDAVVYENAYTNAVFTRSSVATLLTGLYPDSHKTRVLQARLPAQLLLLTEYLKAKGYRSSVITSSFAISPHFGFTQGVDDYFRVSEKDWAPKDDTIFTRFRDWLPATPSGHYAYMHYLHPHFPKVPPHGFPVSFRPGGERVPLERLAQLVRKEMNTGTPPDAAERREITDAYDSSIAWVDAEFGKILALLRERKLYDGSLVIFLADHGEALLEHGVLGHGDNVYEETSRVPLIVKYPAAMGLKGRVRRLTELADIFPTVAALFGQALTLDGRVMAAPGAGLDDHVAVSRTFNRGAAYGLRWRDWYYIVDLTDNREQLFALAADPLRESGDRHPRIREFLNARFLSWYGRFRNIRDYSVEANLKRLPAAELEEMKALGYL